jgi:hypothetical protein
MPADSTRCPECGFAVDPAAPAVSRVPWNHFERGALRAYLRTVALVTVRPRRFVEEVVRPAGVRQARWFRRITTTLVLLPLLFYVVMASPYDPTVVAAAARDVAYGVAGSFDPWAAPWMYGAGSPVVRAACVAAGLYLVIAAGGWVLRWRDTAPQRRDRARALMQYSCAPLLAWPVVFLAGCAVVMLMPQTFFIVSAYVLCGLSLLVLGVVEWWWVQVLLVHRATRSTGHAIAAAALLPLAWAGVAGLVLFLVPWLIGWVLILAASF